jgi:predicted  nucleic acid-binding Zn-ribbon protein
MDRIKSEAAMSPCGCGKNVPQLSEAEIAAREERQRVAREQALAVRAARVEEQLRKREASELLRKERRERQLEVRAERLAARQT